MNKVISDIISVNRRLQELHNEIDKEIALGDKLDNNTLQRLENASNYLCEVSTKIKESVNQISK